MTSATTDRASQRANAYNLIILVLTVVSLAVMVLLWLPLPAEVINRVFTTT